ncbi:cyclic peptide transporter [Paenibacillus shirakamiensis]|uniref:Cyclic peptide transporter n=1 Tax=Paenibacillus shirakamiensis TaxID=1265935 RepID=A0ABS4JFW1_9BACL|nr:cyclic peptide export ABC transporter [Paenibacillus shirakamiensis]MBP2000610.1 cyclic peptide transporter [Paenibacillus shirakamiensis]
MKYNSRHVLLFMVILLCLLPHTAWAAPDSLSAKESEIEQYIQQNMKKSDIPGLSVVIVEGKRTVYQKSFGYANVSTQQPVTPDTLFELGSTSKAFTALAILQLEEEGRIHLENSVSKYLPWFHMSYQGHPAKITLSQLLHHTSGIPFQTIGDIPATDKNTALEDTIRPLVGQTLDHSPGEKYLYATINYDILGLIIQKVSGQSYESYMAQHIFAPLGLEHTVLFREEAAKQSFAKGYKFNLLRPKAYNAPMYRGNSPAGYIITNGLDVAKWIQIQLGADPKVSPALQALIKKSHVPDRTVMPDIDGSSYAAGWSIFQKGSGEISHTGSNPNFSSQIVLRPAEGIGIGILANMNSPYTSTLADGIMDIIQGKELPVPTSDIYKSLDNMASAILFITLPIMLLTLWFTGSLVKQVVRQDRVFVGTRSSMGLSLLVLLMGMTGFAYCLYRIPDVLYWGLNWTFLSVWAPQSLVYGIVSLFLTALIFSVYFILIQLFPQTGDKSLFVLIMLSIASGFGNALIIFIVNEALNRDIKKFQGGLLLYFILGITIYAFGQKLVRTKLVRIANQMVFEKRTELLDKILKTSYQKVEALEEGSIQASLNNDTETISEFSNIVITGATSLVTLICCFVYMGMISPIGVVVAILVIILAAGVHYVVGLQANKLWEQTRDIQNTFFKFIHDLTHGFKELWMHEGKSKDFQEDMQDSSKLYRDKRIQGDLKFANANVIGELLFTFVIGVVAFVFPILFPELKVDSLRSYVFVLLYMTGPLHGILGTIPNIFKVRVSWNRIEALSKQLDIMQDTGNLHHEQDSRIPKTVELELKAVEYHYSSKDGESFTVGPIDYAFHTGEITFITGGNGSGKSTLAKLLTGLYTPTHGEIWLGGQPIHSNGLGQNYSAIFSDFHLFEKMYGIPYREKHEEISRYLKLLHLEEKVHIENGMLNTIKLSTGQRKRLALLISYLEDRPIYLFDEWAADQDPEYRAFFYHTLLPELKMRGKCIIAITHDDRFFNLADRVIKMDMGQMVQSESHLSTSTELNRLAYDSISSTI